MREPSSLRERDPDPFSEQMIALMVAAAGIECEVLDAEPLRTGSATTYRVGVRDQEGDRRTVVFKAAVEGDATGLRREPALLRYVADHTSIPVPDVYGSHLQPDDLPAPSFVMEHVEGGSPTRASARENGDTGWPDGILDDIVRQAGRHLAALHDCGPVSGFGPITVDDGTLTVTDPAGSWQSWLRELAAETEGDTRLDGLASTVQSVLDSELPELPAVDPVLAHYDYQPRNVVVDEGAGRVRAVLDWGGARSVHDEFELAVTEQYCSGWAPLGSDKRQRVRASLHEGYRDRRSLATDEAFRRRRRLYLLLSTVASLSWAPYWSGPRAERFVASQRSLVESLLDQGP
ncbi:phosphotransferase family protein [Halomicrobium katesii]|uniref:phosphotransferase family protein n=1 Tax=Halomicrobium katesii TaxID=437163 RepID=UPI0003620F17|nr:phosphotransferase [Halomicrobium katesii]